MKWFSTLDIKLHGTLSQKIVKFTKDSEVYTRDNVEYIDNLSKQKKGRKEGKKAFK
uniref:Uncharacterized protein n=1 Tax=Arion vulgaris TaxID=1028688 RepID=A0A0B7BLJ1_9EUPU